MKSRGGSDVGMWNYRWIGMQMPCEESVLGLKRERAGILSKKVTLRGIRSKPQEMHV